MSDTAERWACDTSVAVAALDPNHEAHAPCRAAVLARRPVLAGRAAFEAYSVLTRLPVPLRLRLRLRLRLSAGQAASVLAAAFPSACWLSECDSAALKSRLGELGIVGGSVYDALVGRAAAADGRVLLTADRRAERTYRALDVPYEVVA